MEGTSHAIQERYSVGDLGKLATPSFALHL
nr:hypothetical protein JMPHXYHW_JMPHXYHW_CDS_0023 [uncultured phage]